MNASPLDIACAEFERNLSPIGELLRKQQQHAVARFRTLNWPTQVEEEWRRTNIGHIDFAQFNTVSGQKSVVSLPKQADALSVYSASQQHPATLDVQQIGTQIASVVAERIATADNRFILWSYLAFADVIFISIPQKVVCAEPIVIETRVCGDNALALPLVIIQAAPLSDVTIVHTVISDDDTAHLCVSDTIIHCAAAATVRYIQSSAVNIDSLHFSNGCSFLARDARMRFGTIVLGGMMAKARFDAYLNGEGSEAHLDGIYIAHADQHFDLRTLQVHQAPHTNSFALYRGVILDEAHTIYQGLIRVTPAAVGTDAYLTNNNLMLSDEARADSIPSLNISTDDVKCSHGSTTGKIDQLQLFYLQARGLSQVEATALLIEGFVAAVTDRFPEMCRAPVYASIQERAEH